MIAYNGFDARKLALLFHPDRIIFDIQMLRMAGPTAAVAHGFSAAAIDYTAKPFSYMWQKAGIWPHITPNKTRHSQLRLNARLARQLRKQHPGSARADTGDRPSGCDTSPERSGL